MLLLLAEVTPRPVSYTEGTTIFEVAKLQCDCKLSDGKDCASLINPVYDAYYKAMFPKSDPKPDNELAALKTIHFTLLSGEYSKDIATTDESYELTVNKDGVFVNCNTPDGIARAFATLSQLIVSKPGDKYFSGKYAIYDAKVTDQPEFHFRQLLVDSSRHFLPLATLKREVLGISMAKLNCLHLHIVDSESNSFAAETSPADNMEKAAYVTGKPYLHSKADIIELAEYARPLGVFIMVEYDMPGHATSWQKADPSIVTNCPAHGYTSINPINELTYEYIDAYVKDVFETATLSGAIPVIHLGGDEVDHGCWNEDPEISSYMREHGLSTVSLWEQFHQRVVDIILAQNPLAYIEYWEESYENGNKMAQNAIVNFWTNINEIGTCTMEGIYAVRTQGWYLDILEPGSSHYLYEDSWQDMYKVDPYQGVSEANRKFVLGGGACIWGEFADDGIIDNYVWPRTIAPSEVLWSEPSNRDINDALTTRFNNFSCKLRQMGMRAGPVEAGAPCEGVDEPNPKYAQ